MTLPNLGAHPRAVDMGITEQREIRSNERDYLLEGSNNGAVDISVAAGGTITPTTEERLGNGFIRFTGAPATDPVLDITDQARQISFFNDSTRAMLSTASDGDLLLEAADSLQLEDGSGNLLLEASSTLVPIGETRIFQKDGDVFRTLGLVGLQTGALLHSGQVNPTALIDFDDEILAKVEFKDYAFIVDTPSSSSGTLVLDVENGNYFSTTLTEAVTTLTLSNPFTESTTIILIATQDGTGTWEITWPASVIWEQATGESPAQTTTANAVDIFMLQTVDTGTTWYGFILGLNMG